MILLGGRIFGNLIATKHVFIIIQAQIGKH